MCTEDNRTKSKSVGLPETKQNDPKKFMSNSSQTSLEHKPRGLMAENNIVYNTVRQKYICCLLRYKMLKVQQRVNVDE